MAPAVDAKVPWGVIWPAQTACSGPPVDPAILLKSGRLTVQLPSRPRAMPGMLARWRALARRCRIMPYWIKRGAYGAAGPASAPPLGLGRPARRTPGHTYAPRRPSKAHLAQRLVAARCRPFSAMSSSRPQRRWPVRWTVTHDRRSHIVWPAPNLSVHTPACDSTRQERSRQEAVWGTRFECHQRSRSG